MIGISELASNYLDKTEYDRVIITIRNLVRLSQTANRRALIRLGYVIPDLEHLEPFLLRKGIEWLTNACDYIEIINNMDNLINSSSHEGMELLEQLIIREGVLLIKAGYSPNQLLDTISSLLGEDFCKSIEHLDLLKEDDPLDIIVIYEEREAVEIIRISELASSYLHKTEYDRVIIIIRNLVRLSQTANRRGVLSLGYVIPNLEHLEPFLLRKGIEWLTDACDYIEIINNMDNLINSSSHEGMELLEQLIIRKGVLLILAGYSPNQLLDTISSLLGEDFCKSIEHLDLLKEDETWDLIDEKPCYDLKDADSLENILENIIININQNEEMEKLIKKAGTLTIAWALKGISRNTTKHIFNHISNDTQDEIKSLIKKIGPVRLIDVQEAQKWAIIAHRF